MEIKNSVIIITGGTGCIAIAAVKRLLERDAKFIALFDLKAVENRGRSLIEKLEGHFGKGKLGFFACDVTDKKDFAEKYDQIVKTHGRVDILINNAAIFNDLTPELEIDINFKALVMCTLTAIERMGKHNGGKGGTILNISSIGAFSCHPKYPVYVATKAAVTCFTKSLKGLYETHGIRILSMCPGLTKTPMSDLKKPNYLDIVSHLPKVDEYYMQSPDNVGYGIAEAIEKGEPGAIWVSELDEPPCVIEEETFYRDRKIPIS